MIIILILMLFPALLLAIIGIILMGKQKKKIAKVLFILSGVYLLISFGTCGYVFYEFNTNGKL